jgi:hypothetical protein
MGKKYLGIHGVIQLVSEHFVPRLEQELHHIVDVIEQPAQWLTCRDQHVTDSDQVTYMKVTTIINFRC